MAHFISAPTSAFTAPATATAATAATAAAAATEVDPPPGLPPRMATQSGKLSKRHIVLHKDGRTLVDDSNISEGNLKTIIQPLLSWASECTHAYGGSIQYLKKISLEDLENRRNDPHFIIHDPTQEKISAHTTTTTCASNVEIDSAGQYYYRCANIGCTGACTSTDNSRVSIKPDAGIIMWTYRGIQYPIYIGEDKVQGTNDNLFAAGKPRQATGNAIERYFKNVRAEEMMCANLSYFPSVVFASGCDFHHTETIAKRLEVGNYGVPNHYAEVTPDSDFGIQHIVDRLSVNKISTGIYSPFTAIASVCVKAHKWDQMPHNSSLWKPVEYLAVSKRIVELAIREVVIHADNVHDD